MLDIWTSIIWPRNSNVRLHKPWTH